MFMLIQKAETAVVVVEETAETEISTISEAVALAVVVTVADSEETGTVVSAVTGTEVSAEETVTEALEERPMLRQSATELLLTKNLSKTSSNKRKVC